MKLNERKTKNMVFNFTKKYQFSTNLKLNGEIIEVPQETKLLGTIITNDLKWDRNTHELVKKAYKRMQLLYTAVQYTTSINDLRTIYITFIRSILEHSSVVWHSSLTVKNIRDLERIQKMAVRIIMGRNFESYEKGRKILNLETLKERREKLCIKFAQKCTENEKLKNWFPLRKVKGMKTRKQEKFKIFKASSKRYKNSAIPFMRRLLNKDNLKKKQTMKC